LPPDRISESDMAGRVFWQMRISIEVMRTRVPPCGQNNFVKVSSNAPQI